LFRVVWILEFRIVEETDIFRMFNVNKIQRAGNVFCSDHLFAGLHRGKKNIYLQVRQPQATYAVVPSPLLPGTLAM